MNNCVGINFCSVKTCLEQGRCKFNINRHIEFKPAIPSCQVHLMFCINQQACEILGKCIQEHPLVKKDKMARKQLRKQCGINTIIKIMERLMPPLKRIGQRKYYKPGKQ